MCYCPRDSVYPLSPSLDTGPGSQVSETEREDFEESEKTQYWVERLCQTRLQQISSAENEIAEVTEASFRMDPPLEQCTLRTVGGVMAVGDPHHPHRCAFHCLQPSPDGSHHLLSVCMNVSSE